jgi:hypothetical protein
VRGARRIRQAVGHLVPQAVEALARRVPRDVPELRRERQGEGVERRVRVTRQIVERDRLHAGALPEVPR